MTKLSKGLTVFFFCLGFIFLNPQLQASQLLQDVNTWVDIEAPTQVSMEIFWWIGRTLPAPSVKVTGGDNRVVDGFNFTQDAAGICLPGRTSWADSDGWTARDGNVGFTARCIGPIGSTLRISTGKLKNISGTGEIPYSETYTPPGSTPITVEYFGFSCRLDDEGGRYVAGSAHSMQLHSFSGWSFAMTSQEGYGHNFSVYNLLYVPPNARPGIYQTTGTTGYEHLTVSFL